MGHEFGQQERNVIDATLGNADKCSVRVLRKSPILTPHRSVRTSKAHSHTDSFPFPVSTEPGGDSAHTKQFSDYLSFKSVTNAMKVGMFWLRCSFVAGVAKYATIPFVIAQREEVENTLGRNVNSKLLRVW